MIIVTFSDPEEQIAEKIKAVSVEDHEIECISIVDGKEMESDEAAVIGINPFQGDGGRPR